MIFAIVFSFVVNGKTVMLFEPVGSLEQCRKLAIEYNKTATAKGEEISYCGAFILDKKRTDTEENINE